MPDAPLTDCWVWVVISDEEVSIIGYRSGDQHYPLIATDPETAQYNAERARIMHGDKIGSPNMHHIHFTNAEELEIIDGQS